ncbi:MAG: hypothetical protein K2Q45_03225 [Nitrosomonas sp.]|nr:hypothetical protein [Nitrosomonas sp.]
MTTKENPYSTPLWVLTFLFAGVVFFYTFWSLLCSTYVHTYLRPATAPTGLLFSQRFSADFFFTGSLLLLFFVPLTMAFMLGDPVNSARQVVHIVLVMILILYFTVILLFWGIGSYAYANKNTTGNAYNPANDDRWCCVNYLIAGTSCDNVAACPPGITQEMLVINDVFLFKFWFLFVFILLLIVELAFVANKFPPMARAYANEQAGALSEQQDPGDSALVKRFQIRVPYKNRK